MKPIQDEFSTVVTLSLSLWGGRGRGRWRQHCGWGRDEGQHNAHKCMHYAVPCCCQSHQLRDLEWKGCGWASLAETGGGVWAWGQQHCSSLLSVSTCAICHWLRWGQGLVSLSKTSVFHPTVVPSAQSCNFFMTRLNVIFLWPGSVLFWSARLYIVALFYPQLCH